MYKLKFIPGGGYDRFFDCNDIRCAHEYSGRGLKKHGEPLKMNWNAITGKKGKCHVYVDNYKNKDGEDRQSNKIKKLYAYDENVTTVQPAQTQTPQYSQPAQTGGWKAGAF